MARRILDHGRRRLCDRVPRPQRRRPLMNLTRQHRKNPRMHRASMLLVGLTLLAPAVDAAAADAPSDHAALPPPPVVPVPANEAPAVAAQGTPPAAARRFQIGVQFLAMPLGQLDATQA